MSNGVIQVTADAVQNLTANTSAIKFTDVTLRTNSANCFNGWAGFNEDDAQVNIVAGGIYDISFDANITSASTGIVGIAIFANGNQLAGAEADETVTTANNWKNVALNKKIRVCVRGNATITIRSIPSILIADVATATQIPSIKNANLSIEKIA